MGFGVTPNPEPIGQKLIPKPRRKKDETKQDEKNRENNEKGQKPASELARTLRGVIVHFYTCYIVVVVGACGFALPRVGKSSY